MPTAARRRARSRAAEGPTGEYGPRAASGESMLGPSLEKHSCAV
jgi:hypothetical protein